MLAVFHSDGFLGRVAYGAQSRIMDGVLGRANCLVIMTLWLLFRFVMVPLGAELAAAFPPHTYAALFAVVWVSYLGSDALSEIVGSLWGKQRLRVWGIGEVNRKSVAGTVACFLGSLAICLGLVRANGLGWPWVGLAVAVSVSNTAMELLSPRGTDDFTMATGNALVCWAFGRLVY
jgi:dolichol kinase